MIFKETPKHAMMRVIITLLIILSVHQAVGQSSDIDILKNKLANASSDTQRISILGDLAAAYNFINADTSLLYANEGLKLAEKINDPARAAKMKIPVSAALTIQGNYPLSLNYGLDALSYFEKTGDSVYMVWAIGNLNLLYKEMGDYDRALKNMYATNEMVFRIVPDEDRYSAFAFVFDRAGQSDSAIKYARQTIKIGRSWSGLLVALANSFARKGYSDSALFYYRRALEESRANNLSKDIVDCYNGIAGVYRNSGKNDSSKYYLKNSINEKNINSYMLGKLRAFEMLSNIYETENNSDSALYYLKNSGIIREKLFSNEKQNAINNLFFTREQQLAELEKARQDYESRLKQNLLLSGLLIFILASGLLTWNIRQKQRSLALIEKEKKEVELQKSIAENALDKLKRTQQQLVQSEKLASLGELTSGIAHEIQNPLNFVNNFSELNMELCAEMGKEIDSGNFSETKKIFNDLYTNSEKILQHGKRADAIVKNMLQHAQSSGGHKEPTSINVLAEEYLRLSLHGVKIKDKTFNADLIKNFDKGIGRIDLVPQEIGRVLFNIYNNAFYAVAAKVKAGAENYFPAVSVSTKKADGKVEIRISDNGTGMNGETMKRIFQPFFTTKPTGEGTGLGLSLSYDIIKAHGGEIAVESREGEGTTFIISLPG